MQIDSFRAQAETLASARGVVFDLRGYPNGNHEVLTYLTDENLKSAFWRVPEIIYPDGDGEPRYRESRWDLPPGSTPVPGHDRLPHRQSGHQSRREPHGHRGGVPAGGDRGIRPAILVAPTIRGMRDGRDELLERAVEVIRSGATPSGDR